MGTDQDRSHSRPPHRRSRRRRTGVAVLLSCGALVLAGCASMPDSGDVRRVDSSPRTDIDSRARVYGVQPGKGEQPVELVSGFLEATTSDEENFDTAKEYLSKDAARNWDPFALTRVLAQPPTVVVEHNADRDGEADGITIVISGKQLATVDAKHAYEPRERDYETRIHVAKVGTEWRIDSLPQGLVIGEADFQRIYRSVNRYYFAELGPDAPSSRFGEDVLVADPVYLRGRIDLVTSTVKALMDGPTSWLDPVVSTAFPTGTVLGRASQKLTLDDSNGLTVRLSDKAAGISQVRCHRMAAQLLFTVKDQAPSKVDSVRLERNNGSELCAMSGEAASAYAPDRVNGNAEHQYFVDENHRMVRLADEEDQPAPVPGPFGKGSVQLGTVAVSRDERLAAGVTRGGDAMYVTELAPGADLGTVRLRSHGGSARNGLTAPSWDGLGGLWVADRDPQHPRLLRLQEGVGAPQSVRIPGLDGSRITALRVSADGTRIALLVETDGHTTLRLGRIERGGSGDAPQLTVDALRPIAPQLEDVDAVSWAGSSRLVVAGRESGGLQQLQYVETDGSPANVPETPGPNGVETLAATEDPKRPLIAQTTDDGIVRLHPNADWKTVTKGGSAPVYPG